MNETEQKIVLLCAALGVVAISFLIITEGLFITLRGVFEISIRARNINWRDFCDYSDVEKTEMSSSIAIFNALKP